MLVSKVGQQEIRQEPNWDLNFASCFYLPVTAEFHRREEHIMRSSAPQAVILMLLIGLLSILHAQSTTTGNINGTVRDAQGAAVPDAEVTIQQENGTARVVKTNDDGFYSAPSLPVGRYSVSVGPQGFKKTVNNDVELHVGDNLVVNFSLEVGQVTETVNSMAAITLSWCC
jgi:hypothetical protein